MKISCSAQVETGELNTLPANNNAWITYGKDETSTEPSSVEIYNATFTVTATDQDNNPLGGAGYVLCSGNGYYHLNESSKAVNWYVLSDGQKLNDAIKDGKVTECRTDPDTGKGPSFTGLADGTYTLKVSTIPAEHTKGEDKAFTVSAHNYKESNLIQSAAVTHNVHVHQLSYALSADGTAIIASCSKPDCPQPDVTATLTISAPPHTVYGDGKETAAVITDENSIRGTAAVTYFKADESGEKNGTALTAAPTDAGKYRAEITLGTGENSATAYTVYTIAKAEPTVTAPEGKTGLVENGSAQALAEAGSVTGGTMQYALGTDATTAPEAGWSAEIPSVTAAGTYYVWYKAAGDANHGDSRAACVTAKVLARVSVTVTFKVVNGSWGDGTREDKPVILSGPEGEELWLALSDIPDVTEPDEGYEYRSGVWTPEEPPVMMDGRGFGNPITEDTTYTFSYGKKKQAVITGAPAAKDLTCTGQAQALVTAGAAEGGTVKYTVSTKKTQMSEDWSETVPTGTEAGTYYVWYKAFGDETHSDSTPACVEVTIKEAKERDEPEEETPMDKATRFLLERGYRLILGREPDKDGLAWWKGEIDSSRMAAADVILYFLSSREFTDKNVSNKEKVRILYKVMLNREPDAEGLEFWTEALDSGEPVSSLVDFIGDTEEFEKTLTEYDIEPKTVVVAEPSAKEKQIQAFVRRCYKLILGREAEEEGLSYWTGELKNGKATAAEIIHLFMHSEEFKGKNYGHGQEVTILYRAMLNREPDEPGKAYWVALRDGGQPIAAVINGFCVSEEFKEICVRYGIKPGSVKICD